MADSNSASIAAFLTSKNLPPTAAWLNNFISTNPARANVPLLAQQKTALFRILSSDLTVSVQPASTTTLLPTDIANPETKQRVLPGPITVQVLDIEDIAHSRWSQLEALEARERGEMVKGREVVRVVPSDEDGTGDNIAPSTRGTHKLLLQDANGTKLYAFELAPVEGLAVGVLSIGAKLVLRNITVARGVALLEASAVEVLGGKVEAWDKKWKAERKDVLKRTAGMGES